MSLLLDLPPELVIRILLHLSPRDITTCQLALPSLSALIDDFILMEYHIATQVAGVEDNPDVKLSVHDRLERLRALEDGWARLNFDFSKTVEVVCDGVPHPNPFTPTYGLKDGVFMMANMNKPELELCPLPSKVEDETKWRSIDVDKPIDGVGLGIYEHDLVAVIVATPQPNVASNIHSLEIVLLEFSTGEPHPEAQQPHLFVEEPWVRGEKIGVEIVGDTLALMVPCYDNPFNPNDDFYLFDWKTGALKMHATAPSNSYAGLFFLSPTLILLPNSRTNNLEFWDAASTSPFPIGALGLPPINKGYYTHTIDCRCQPNPVAKGTPHSRQPFRTATMDAIAIFNIQIRSDDNVISQFFSMYVHRGTLLGLCPSVKDVDMEGVFEVVPWETWGPGVTRCLNANITTMMPTGDITEPQTITTTAGARAVVIVENSAAVVIMDFHPARIRSRTQEGERNDMHMWGEAWETGITAIASPALHGAQEGERDDMPVWVEAGETVIVSPAFAVPLVSRLPYAARSERYDALSMYLEGVIGLSMDEERLLVLKLEIDMAFIEEIVIHHLGATPAGGEGVGVGTSAGAGAEALSIDKTD